MASIETYCKLCTYNGKRTPPQQEYKVNGRYLYNPIKEGQSYAFDRTWDKNASYSDINSIFPNGSRFKFHEGYNNVFVIKGTSRNIIPLINIKQPKKHENIFLHLVESLCEEWTKKVKMKKKNNNRQSQPIPEDQLHMSIYEVTQQALVDLISNKNLSRSSQPGSFESDHQHLSYLDLSTSWSKDLYNTIMGTITSDLLSKQNNSIIVVEFNCIQLYVLREIVVLISENFEVPQYGVKMSIYHGRCGNVRHSAEDGLPITSWLRVCICPCNVRPSGEIITLELPFHNRNSPQSNDTVNSSKIGALLSEMYGGNCYTKVLYMLDVNMSFENQLLIDHSQKLRHIVNHPVRNTVYLKHLIDKYKRAMQNFEQDSLKSKNLVGATEQEYQDKLKKLEEVNFNSSSKIAQLEEELREMKQEYIEALDMQKEMSDQNVLKEEEKLKMNNETVDLKLQLNELQQQLQSKEMENKAKDSDMHDQLVKLRRAYAFEQKLNEDWKEKHEHLSQDYNDLNEEYLSMKLNYNTLKDKFQEQVQTNETLSSSITKLNKTKELIVSDNATNESITVKEFIGQLNRLCSIVAGRDSNLESTSPLQGDVDVLRKQQHKQCRLLEKTLVTLKHDIAEKDKLLVKLKENLATATSKMLILSQDKEAVEKENEDLNNQLQKLSFDYQTRLKQYISDIKEHVLRVTPNLENNSNILYKQNIENMIKDIESNTKEEIHQKDKENERLKDELKRIKKLHETLLVSYRLYMNQYGKNRAPFEEFSSYEDILASQAQLDIFMSQEATELNTKLRKAEQKVKELEEELRTSQKDGKFTRQMSNLMRKGSNLTTVQQQMHSFNSSLKVSLEKEKAELLTRCLLAEEQLTDCQRELKETTARYENELNQLHHQLNLTKQFADQKYNGNILHGDNHSSKSPGVKYDGFLPPIYDKSYMQYHSR